MPWLSASFTGGREGGTRAALSHSPPSFILPSLGYFLMCFCSTASPLYVWVWTEGFQAHSHGARWGQPDPDQVQPRRRGRRMQGVLFVSCVQIRGSKTVSVCCITLTNHTFWEAQPYLFFFLSSLPDWAHSAPDTYKQCGCDRRHKTRHHAGTPSLPPHPLIPKFVVDFFTDRMVNVGEISVYKASVERRELLKENNECFWKL